MEIFPICGILFLLFRFWLCEGYLRDILKNKRGHTSRFISYYFGIAMLLNFDVNVFTLISVFSTGAMIFALVAFDVPFIFFNDAQQKIPKKVWQIIERLTMHIPPIIFGVYYYLFSPTSHVDYFLLFTIPQFVFALLFTGIPMFVIDPRVVKKEDWPRGPAIVIALLLSIIGNIVVFFWLS